MNFKESGESEVMCFYVCFVWMVDIEEDIRSLQLDSAGNP